jgi:hypothetical protein
MIMKSSDTGRAFRDVLMTCFRMGMLGSHVVQLHVRGSLGNMAQLWAQIILGINGAHYLSFYPTVSLLIVDIAEPRLIFPCSNTRAIPMDFWKRLCIR